MNTSLVFITGVIVLIGAIFSVISFMNFEPTQAYTRGTTGQETVQNARNGSNVSQGVSGTRLSGVELAKHTVQADCWVGYQGKIYDLTSWLPKHPGSAGAIAPYCGTSTEFEQAFTQKHGTSKASLFMKVAVYKGELQ